LTYATIQKLEAERHRQLAYEQMLKAKSYVREMEYQKRELAEQLENCRGK
jgi:hypothetical protein